MAADRDQRAPDRFYRLAFPNTGRGYVNVDQLRGGYLQRVGQGHDLGSAVECALAELDAGQLRPAHPSQPGNHLQGLALAAADQTHLPTDHERILVRLPAVIMGRLPQRVCGATTSRVNCLSMTCPPASSPNGTPAR